MLKSIKLRVTADSFNRALAKLFRTGKSKQGYGIGNIRRIMRYRAWRLGRKRSADDGK